MLVNDVYKFHYMCMVKFINLHFVNYYLFFRKFISIATCIKYYNRMIQFQFMTNSMLFVFMDIIKSL